MLDFFTQMMGSASPIALNQGMGQSSFPASLIQSESGGDWGALNNERGSGGVRGHGGRLQFGDARLTDAARAGVIPRLSPDQFAKQSPRIQRRVEEWHFRDIDDQIRRRGLDRFVGEEIDGQPVTMDAMRSVAHLGGMGGLQKFLETGGRHNPQDSFGTSLSDYHRRHGGGQANQPRRADMPAQGAMPASMERPMQPQPRPFDQRFVQMFDEQGMGQGRPIPQAPQPRRAAEAERVEPIEVPSSLMDSRPISGRSDMMEPGRRLAPEPQGNENFRVPGGPGPRPDMVSPPADMPARGARPQSGQLPPAPDDPDRRAMGVEPRQNPGLLGNLFGGGRQQGNQQGGERQGFMSPAMSDFFTAMGESLLTSPGHSPLAGFPKAMQALRVASMDREKSAAEQNAIRSVLRRSGVPDDTISEIIASPQAVKMELDRIEREQAQQRELQERQAAQQATNQAIGTMTGGAPASGQAARSGLPRSLPTDRFASPQEMSAGQQPAPQSQGSMIFRPEDQRNAENFMRIIANPNIDDRVRKQAEEGLKVLRDRAAPSGDSSRQEQIALLDETLAREIPDPERRREVAVGIATGRFRADREPVSGALQIADMATGRVIYGGPQSDSAIPSQDHPRQREGFDGTTLYESVDRATGLWPTLRETAADTAGQVPLIGDMVEADDIIRARQTFGTETNNLIRALSINPRFPVGEMDRIREEIKIQPGAFRSPRATRARMESVDASLRMRMQNEMRAAEDNSLPVDTRRAAAQAANDIRNFLAVLGVPGPINRSGDDDDVSDLLELYGD